MTDDPSTRETLAQCIALAIADIYKFSGSHIDAPHPVFVAATNGDQVKLGMCIAASFMQAAVSELPEGLAAFGDLLHKPRLHNVQGE